MTLQFFRRHRKAFMVLMAAAVFAMVTFSALAYAPEAWTRLKTRFTGRNPNDPEVYKIYGRPVSRSEYWTVRKNLEVAVKYQQFVAQYDQLPRIRAQKEGARKVEILDRYSSVLPGWFNLARDEPSLMGGRRIADKTSLVKATLVLLQEAREAGIHVSDEMIQAYVDSWTAAGVENEAVGTILVSVFDRKIELLKSVLRQEMTLSIYLKSVANGAKAFKEDVDESFRLDNEKVNVEEVVLWSSDFKKEVAEPTAEQLAGQFERYKGTLAWENPNGFGYKIPDRIKFQYLKASVEDAAKEVPVTDEEIKQYYEKYKDNLYVVPEAQTQQQKPAEKKGDEKPQPAGSGRVPPGEAPKAQPAENKTGQPETPKAQGQGESSTPPAGREEAKKLNAPDAPGGEAKPAAEAAKTDAPATPPAGAQPQTPDKAAGSADQTAPQGQPKSVAKQAAPPAASTPKKYRPLEEVRGNIEQMLRRDKAQKLCEEKAKEALEQLKKHQRLSLEHVADGKVLKWYDSDGFVSQQDLRKVRDIGASYLMRSVDIAQREPFYALAFSIEPFAGEPRIYLNRPEGVLTDFWGNRFIFTVTAVEPAHAPKSVDEVRQQVSEDLKKVAAYQLATKRAEALLAAAAEKGLAKVAEQEKLSVEKPEFPLTRRGVKYGDPLAATVFEALAAGQKLGKVDSPWFDRLLLFEIKEVTYSPEDSYRRIRSNLASQAIKVGQDELRAELIDPEMLIRRSGLKETGESLEARPEDQRRGMPIEED